MALLNKITPDCFRDLLDELNLTHRKVSDSDFMVPLEADDDFDHNVHIVFCIQESRMQAWACVNGYGVENPYEDSLRFCNKWNKEKVMPKAYLDDDGDFIVEISLFTDEPLDEEYVKTNFIRVSCSFIWSFFKELKSYLDSKN